MPCGRVLRLHNNVECLRLDIRGLWLDRQCIGSKGLSDSEFADPFLAGNDVRPARLARLACQKSQIVVDLGLARPLEFFGNTGARVYHGNCEIRPPDRDWSTAVVDDLRSKMIDDARTALPVCDGRDPATNADGRGRGVDSCGALMTKLPSDEAKRALGQRDRHLAGTGCRVVYERVDDEIAVRTDVERCLVGEEDLHAPAGGRLYSLLVDDLCPYTQNMSFSARRCAMRLRIDRGRCPDFLGKRGQAQEHRAGEQHRNGDGDICT